MVKISWQFKQYGERSNRSFLMSIQAARSDVLDRPYFGDNARNVTALADETVTLKCTVRNKGNRTVRETLSWLLTRSSNKSSDISPSCTCCQVSWIRRRDLAILTSNIFVYTTDTRFSVIHIPDSNNWDLRVKPVSEKDRGVYECQCNTEPKINFPIHLDVISE